MIGISLRFALAAGLHLRNDDSSASPSKKETLIRTWWSLHSVESLLCTLIGRPCVIPNDQCTVPLPSVSSEGQSGDGSSVESTNQAHWQNKGTALLRRSSPDTSIRGDSDTVTRISFLGARVTMGLIMQKALSRLYSPQTTVDSWEQIQEEIESLSKELDEWVAAALPEELRPANPIQESGTQRERLLLSFQYHSAKLLIYRPCLCHIERRIKDQSGASASFNEKKAEACVQAAQAMTQLFPEELDCSFIYQQSPWWCIVRNIMQAAAVFLLEMSFDQTHMARPNGRIVKSIKMLVRWLHFTSFSNAVAARAYEVVADIVRTGAQRLRIDAYEILGEARANVNRNESLQAYQPPENTVLPWYRAESSLQAEWGMPPSNDHTATAESSTRLYTTFQEQQPVPPFEQFQFDQHFMLEPGLQMSSLFRNPFFTNFDLPGLLDGQLPPERDAIMDDG